MYRMAEQTGQNGGGDGTGATLSGTKKCFVVSEFGADEKTRTERKQTLKHLVKKVLEPMATKSSEPTTLTTSARSLIRSSRDLLMTTSSSPTSQV